MLDAGADLVASREHQKVPVKIQVSRVGYLMVLAMAFVIGMAASSFAVQDGRLSTNNQSIDAASAYISGSSFNPRAGHCVLYAILATDTNSRHVESGVTRCGSSIGAGGIDGTCPSGRVFNERWAGGSTFACVPGGAFSNGSFYYAYSQRGSGNTFTSTMGGASISQGGFTGLTQTIAWGETTNTQCPDGSAVGSFSLWSRTVNGTSASVGGQVYNGGGGPCWSVGSISSGGFFDVIR